MGAFPNQDTTNPSLAGTLLVSTAIAQGITNAATLPAAALLQEVATNLMLGPSAGNMLSASATAVWGYTTGAGSTVTQASNKTTAVTINKPVGNIVTSNAAMNNATNATFTVSNSLVAATDVPLVAVGAGTTGSYRVSVSQVGAGTFDITLNNFSAVSLTEAVTVNFSLLKGVIA